MHGDTQTHDERSFAGRAASENRVAGLLLVSSGGRPCEAALPLTGDAIEIGRSMAGLPVEDGVMSRHHARVSYDRAADAFTVQDLESRNGTAVDGSVLARGATVRGAFRILRAGGSLFLLLGDLGPHLTHRLERSGERVIGARLHAAWEQIARSGASPTLHITGETGSGKELAARAYHQAGPHARGPFVAVNCAAIPEGVAERLLFGARRGAFSGATADAEGYLQAADGGTLFLDEIGDLELSIQAKLLRVLETREVLPLGSSRPVPVDLHLCSATHHDLTRLVADKRFRADLFYRIGRPHVAIPPLRQRLDEIPQLVWQAVRSVGDPLESSVSLVETCLLRPWPGNVRELLVEVSEAARQVTPEGGNQVLAAHLSPRAGVVLEGGAAGPSPGTVATMPSQEVIVEALRRHQGRVASAARALGVRRNQLRRWLARSGLDPKLFGGAV